MPYLEFWGHSGPRMIPLDVEELALGRGPDNHLSLDQDLLVSRDHAVLELHGTKWLVRDLDSSNGTFVNGKRITGAAVLRDGDELRLGSSILVFRSEHARREVDSTVRSDSPPELTRREREVLAILCGAEVQRDLFTEPPSIREMARRLFISEAAVKQHLAHLYDKFGIHEGSRRRTQLANEAIRRGVIPRTDASR